MFLKLDSFIATSRLRCFWRQELFKLISSSERRSLTKHAMSHVCVLGYPRSLSDSECKTRSILLSASAATRACWLRRNLDNKWASLGHTCFRFVLRYRLCDEHIEPSPRSKRDSAHQGGPSFLDANERRSESWRKVPRVPGCLERGSLLVAAKSLQRAKHAADE